MKAKLIDFQATLFPGGEASAPVNDFEQVVFEQHPRLKAIRNRLLRAGAATALMTGSGSSIFGIFPNRAALVAARMLFDKDQVFAVRYVTASAYRSSPLKSR